MERISSSSLRYPNALFSNIWLTRALQSLAENELQTYMMYDQTGSRISLSNELSSLEDIYCVQTLKSWSVKSFLIRRLDKYGRNKCAEISRKASTPHEQIPGLTKTEFIKCALRIVITDLCFCVSVTYSNGN